MVSPVEANFAQRAILESMGRDPDEDIARATHDETRRAYQAATDRARQLGVFGSPTFIVGQELFWGDDRLEDAIAWCKAQ